MSTTSRVIKTVLVAAATAAAATAAVLAARNASLRWGATDDEFYGPLPGDELVPDADLISTRAITVQAPADRVWPWLAQIGQNRGGFYSYDELENLVGCDIHSADEIIEEWQSPAIGDEVTLAPGAPGLRIAEVEPGSHLVLLGAVAPGMDDDAMPYEFSWSFNAVPADDGSSRVVVRERYRYLVGWAPLMVEPVEWVSFFMSERMLRGIRDRAEGRFGEL